MKIKIIAILSFCFIFSLNAQEITNKYVVKLKKDESQNFLKRHATSRSASISQSKLLSKTTDVVLIESYRNNDLQLEEWLTEHPLVETWSYDYKAQRRALPNDQYVDLQWDLDLIDVPDVWELTTGGTDIDNREIVIAIIDDSYDLSHPEISNQIWYNEAEVPDDGIDNDNNGYIDDYEGWNAINGSDNHPLTDNHGIAVAGIIGASSNNELGVAGINWDVKLMILSGINKSEVIANYEYILEMRRRYNESNGQQGAYVVATNLSAGVDNKFGSDPQFTAWCDMYDRLGEVGIVSCGATANEDTDVDQFGDIPTTCPSPYLISVTNVDETDAKVERAGYGKSNIDLGSPGSKVLALDKNDGYDQGFGGTSSATPHVTGVIGLLYSVPCQAISNLVNDSPSEAALLLKDAILRGVDENTSLAGITATDGRLNAYGALEVLQETCSELALPSLKGPLSIESIKRGQSSLTMEYITPDEEDYSLLIADRMGRTVLHQSFTPPSFGKKVITVDNLNLNTGIYFISIYNKDNISTKKYYLHVD